MTDPGTIEPLGEALHFLRMSGTFYCRSEFTAPWALALPPFEACMMFHVVTAGQCWLEVEGADACLLRPGDLALVPHGEGHRLASEPGVLAAKLFDLRELISERYEILRHGAGGAPATVICGVVRFDHPAAHHLVRLLPRFLRVDAWSSPEMEWIQSTLRLIGAEARELRTGGETVITRSPTSSSSWPFAAGSRAIRRRTRDGSARSATNRLATPLRSSIATRVATGRWPRWRPASVCRAPRSRRASHSSWANRRCAT